MDLYGKKKLNFQMQKKKIKQLLIGTNNKGKLKEIRDLLPANIKTFPTSKFNLKSPRETGKTFKENSFKGKIGIFDVKNNKINHRLNFYKIDGGEIKEFF